MLVKVYRGTGAIAARDGRSDRPLVVEKVGRWHDRRSFSGAKRSIRNT
ncbi:MAG: hypothetical protein GDA56_25665 [Hormoscilla sp. GM7CHS1pb]|nr:hypothetical protein [Hormoscilla sp. GM7CHS1pb]